MTTARRCDVVVIGAGHSGLAMSARLAEHGIDHVVLERDEVASSWRRQRWDSFTLLTPNFQSQLPGYRYAGSDPDGFMTRAEIVAFIDDYARVTAAPVHTGTTVTSLTPDDAGYLIATDDGTWQCRAAVLASGACRVLKPPSFADAVPDGVVSIDPLHYRNPDDLPEGGVLVVGAASTGMQLADEIHASGRPVTISVGEHVRMVRTHRGRDIQFWMDAIGRLDERYDDVEEILRARGVASPQLIGTPERRSIDLNHLMTQGVQVRGRLGGIRDGVAMFSGGLGNHCALADQKLNRLLDDIDEWIDQTGTAAGPPEARPEPTRLPANLPLTLDLNRGEIRSIVWAIGFQPELSWVDAPVFDSGGRLRHDGGVVDAPGLYYLGATFLRRRKSSFIHGAADDTADLAEHLATHLATKA